MMRIYKLTLTALAALGAFVASAAPAGAAIGYANLCPSLKTALCTEGTLSFPESVAVDNSSGSSAGDVWVTSTGSPEKLVKFDASGNQLLEVGEASIPSSAIQIFGGGAINLHYVAVDSTDGDVYVSSGARSVGEVTKFDSSGVFQLQFTGAETPQGSFDPEGIAVASNGDVYVIDGEHEVVDKFTSSGVYAGEQFSVPRVGGSRSTQAYGLLAVDPKGNVYVTLTGGNSTATVEHSRAQVREYSPTGAPMNCPSGSNVLYEDPPPSGIEFRAVAPVAIDPSDGHIFIGEVSASEGQFIAEYTAPCTAPHARLGAGELAGIPAGIGVSGSSTPTVYVSQYERSYGLVFTQVTLPDVTTGAPATGITRSSATVSGAVNPDETSVTACEFEYGTTPALGHSVPCVQSLPLEGSGPKAVSAEIEGLSLPPASLVSYRLKVANANGANFGEEQTFFTEPLPAPVVGGLPASNVSQFAATLNGTIQTGEALVSYDFEYGATTAYGSVAPVPDDDTPITTERVSVAQPVDGLRAGAIYHYRLVASSPGGTNVAGPDETFTTLPVPAPTVATGGASGVGVGAATLSATIDSHGWDTTYLFEYGTSTAYGSSWPTVPVELGALEGSQPVEVSVPNLLPSTTYHYRLVAANGGGTSYGADMTFTTGEYPAQVIQEPLALRTLLVPGGKVVKPAATHGKKKKGKKNKKGKRGKPRRAARHGGGHKRKGKRKQ